MLRESRGRRRRLLRCRAIAIGLTVLSVLSLPVTNLHAQKPESGSGATQIAKSVGTIKSIQADSITVASEAGGEVTGKLTAATKILRVPPGERDLKNATPLQSQDLQPGDRVLVRGRILADGHTLDALSVIVMKQSDLAEKQQRERDDWQKRGVGGLVTNIDVASGTITISSGGFGPNKSIAVAVGKSTILRRYAPGSVRFDDAKPAPVGQIKMGDQLRARGSRSNDGSQLNADEIVSGSFRNIAGTIQAVDSASNTITVKDLIAKATVVVKLTSDSQMKKLPPEIAQRFAARLKGTSGGQTEDAGREGFGHGENNPNASRSGSSPGSQASRGAGGGPGGNGPDMQRILGRLPNSTLSDLQKGDAVMIVSTEGGNSDAATVITLLAGVDPILTAAPNRSASSLLSPWSLNPSGGEGDAAQQ